ncbi:hypothetical protein I6B53_00125 [Schaalia sp. 19OD2882]|uniref:hypothetical protein n=1 Tax=Schaalia sp. 19OD2882 TaxID=2794089 RepID=UPI001C1F1C11|nr:hypothetical protein [Schaalia sp. 19OD2882]QWW19596.1 hypothetical protein I6B53_00125 [Schaalia sp. 19OD2882]
MSHRRILPRPFALIAAVVAVTTLAACTPTIDWVREVRDSGKKTWKVATTPSDAPAGGQATPVNLLEGLAAPISVEDMRQRGALRDFKPNRRSHEEFGISLTDSIISTSAGDYAEMKLDDEAPIYSSENATLLREQISSTIGPDKVAKVLRTAAKYAVEAFLDSPTWWDDSDAAWEVSNAKVAASLGIDPANWNLDRRADGFKDREPFNRGRWRESLGLSLVPPKDGEARMQISKIEFSADSTPTKTALKHGAALSIGVDFGIMWPVTVTGADEVAAMHQEVTALVSFNKQGDPIYLWEPELVHEVGFSTPSHVMDFPVLDGESMTPTAPQTFTYEAGFTLTLPGTASKWGGDDRTWGLTEIPADGPLFPAKGHLTLQLDHEDSGDVDVPVGWVIRDTKMFRVEVDGFDSVLVAHRPLPRDRGKHECRIIYRHTTATGTHRWTLKYFSDTEVSPERAFSLARLARISKQ